MAIQTKTVSLAADAMRRFAVLIAFAATVTAGGWAATENILVRFTGDNGANPYGTLVFDSAGNLYGTTTSGGPNGGSGAVFELSPVEGGGWKQTILYTFNPSLNPTDGNTPLAGVIFDDAGNLYGTTAFGGGTAGCPDGCGTVFELTPNGQGSWTENVLYRFQGRSDGGNPQAGLLRDAQGNFYGTTLVGGNKNCVSGCGTLFKLTQTSSGSWQESVVHGFLGSVVLDGAVPSGPLVFDHAGNMYGTTLGGGKSHCSGGCGTIFELSPASGGGWQYDVIHLFGVDRNFGDGQGLGGSPAGGVVVDSSGNLFGTTSLGTNFQQGTVFELSPDGQGGWTGKLLNKLRQSTGGRPHAPLLLDAAGNLYGMTLNAGALFELSPSLVYTRLIRFIGTNGASPYSGLVFDSLGNLYGVTSQGGGTGTDDGVAFEVTP
jgi:uncharacterized repeat protein (TIGR03803 family)